MTKIKTASDKPSRNPFRWLFIQNPQFALAFFIPLGILLLAYICFGVYPAGNRSVLSLDLNGQYVYYFDYMHDVFAGRESLFYSWSRSLSGEFMGIIGYYLASPFNFLVWIFPRAHITEGLLAMLVTKAGAIGVCMSVYLSRGRRLNKGTTVIFSMLYALCSYTIVQTMNPMWLDGVMALPLVIYGIESLIRYGRFRMLVLSLVYSFVTCFYIGYMIGIFAAFYFLYYFFASDTFGKIESGAVLARIGLFFISAVTALMCSAFMLMPVYSSLSLGKFAFSKPDYSVRSNFNIMEILGKLLPNSYDTVRMEGLPFLYCGVISVVLLICFFIGGKGISGGKIKPITARKRIACAVLILILTASMYITPVDMLWHGGQLPNWLPYRYSFMLSFLFVSWAAEAFERLSDYPKKLIGGAAFGFFTVMIYLESTDTFNPALGKEGREVLDGISVILPAVLILVIIAAMLLQWRDKLGKKRAVTITLGVLVGCELFYNTIMGIVKQDIDIVYSSRDSYVNVMLPTREVTSEIIDRELNADPHAIFRIEKNFFRTVNDPLALNMYGLSHSSSTLNERPIDLIGRLGLTSRSHYTRYSGATPIMDDLFGIKYILSTNGNETNSIKSRDDITVEENTDAMPVAYLTDIGMADFYFDANTSDRLNVFQLQNRIVSKMIGENYTDYLVTIDPDNIELETENVKYGSASGGHTSYKVETAGKNAQIKYLLTAEKDGEIFLWMPTDYERKINLWVNKKVAETDSSEGTPIDLWKGNLFETDNYCVKSLGEFDEGEEFSVTMTLTKDDLYFKDVFFAYMNKELYAETLQKLHAMNADTRVEKLSPTHLRISVSAETERLLFTTIPVEPGWTLTMDGQKINYTELMPEQAGGEGSLIGAIIPSGQHIIEMKFNVNFYPVALYATGGGFLLLVLLFVLSYRLKKTRHALNADKDEYDESIDEDEASLFSYSGEMKNIELNFTPSENRGEETIENFENEKTDFSENDNQNDKTELTISENESEEKTVSEDGQNEEITETDSEPEETHEEEADNSGTYAENADSADFCVSENEENDESFESFENVENDFDDGDDYNEFIENDLLVDEIPEEEYTEDFNTEKKSEEETDLDFISYSSSSEAVPVENNGETIQEDYSEFLMTEDSPAPVETDNDYDRESVDKNINFILNELDEINKLDDEEEEEQTDTAYEEPELPYAGSADDLFPDEEIEKMETD